MKLNVSFKGKKISLFVTRTGFFRKGFGLMFRTKNTSNLLFEFNEPVNLKGTLTSLFVFFPFLVLWLDQKNRVIDFRVVNPFKISIVQKKYFYRIVEIPFNLKNKKIISFFIGKNNFDKFYRR